MAGIPNVLTIAGSDSGGGAGIQADLKTFAAHRCHGMSVVTAITAQNTRTVSAVHPVPIDIVRAQIQAIFADIRPAAIKIGMLGDRHLIDAVATELEMAPDIPVVLDPVMVAKGGARLLPDASLHALRDRLLPCATVLTPNLPEAAVLLDSPELLTRDDMERAGRELRECGAEWVVMKGGHLDGPVCPDALIGPSVHWFEWPRVRTSNTHGTGCTLSSAIAAQLAHGRTVVESVDRAIRWLREAIRRADELQVGSGHGPVHHFYEQWTP